MGNVMKGSTMGLPLSRYKKHMEEVLAYNEGLPSRFPLTFDFADYSDEQLAVMMEQLVEKGGRACVEAQPRCTCATYFAQSGHAAAVSWPILM